MRLSNEQLAAALRKILDNSSRAGNDFEYFTQRGDPYGLSSAQWHVQLALTQIKILCESIELEHTRQEVDKVVADAVTKGWAETARDDEGNDYLVVLGEVNRFARSLQAVFLVEPEKTVTKDLEAILRGLQYTITDKKAFGTLPENEDAVHCRAEAVLRCVFPCLRHKPPLSKPIKRFEPDTGIPELRTLIEYKYLAERSRVPVVADEILADTRGYHSPEWDSFVYLIYETERFKPEHEWRELLRHSGVPNGTSVIVISGTPPEPRPKIPSGVPG